MRGVVPVKASTATTAAAGSGVSGVSGSTASPRSSRIPSDTGSATKSKTPLKKAISSALTHNATYERTNPILLNPRYPHISDNKSKWVSETNRNFNAKALQFKKK